MSTEPVVGETFAPYATRLAGVLSNLAARDLSQLLVCDPRSIQYLTGIFVEPGERGWWSRLGKSRFSF